MDKDKTDEYGISLSDAYSNYAVSSKQASECVRKLAYVAKRLYDVRSKIVHAGFEAVEKQQLQEMERLAMSALVATTQLLKEIDSHEKLRSILHDRKLA